MVENQINVFLIFVVNGLIIGILFDFFRILRKSFITKDIVTYFQDIIFWILTGVLILYSIFVFNNGEIRLFILTALLLGIITYILCISKHIINITVKIVLSIKHAINKIFIKPISLIIINIQTFSTNLVTKFKKVLKKSKKTLTLEGFKKKM